MTERDLVSVVRVAEQLHPSHPEGGEVFAERLLLYSAGCFVFANASELSGYAISHPWRFKEPPALDTRLGALPDAPTTYYVHDVALLPKARRGGSASRIVERFISEARAGGHTNISLVAVNNSAPFWERHGFRDVSDEALRAKLASYGADARFMARILDT